MPVVVECRGNLRQASMSTPPPRSESRYGASHLIRDSLPSPTSNSSSGRSSGDAKTRSLSVSGCMRPVGSKTPSPPRPRPRCAFMFSQCSRSSADRSARLMTPPKLRKMSREVRIHPPSRRSEGPMSSRPPHVPRNEASVEMRITMEMAADDRSFGEIVDEGQG